MNIDSSLKTRSDARIRSATRTRLSRALPGWPPGFDPQRNHLIGVLIGEGVGAEVVPAALQVLQALATKSSRRFEVRTGGLIGTLAQQAGGRSLSEEVARFCSEVFDGGGAILCGPGGGRFVYETRARFGLFCKLSPLRPLPALADAGIVRPERLAGVDVVAVRENSGGLYFGEWGRECRDGEAETAYHRISYRAGEVDRIIEVACRLAQARRGKVCVTVKPSGVPSISELWEDRAQEAARRLDVDLRMLEIDNAAYQLIANAGEFDVLASPNMFGDILADCGALLLGSRGMSFSGNFGDGGRAIYQTGHGAAYDISGADVANPVGQIHALAMMLRESFDWEQGARLVEDAVASVFAEGFRTPDVAGPGSRVVGTRELTQRICRAIEQSAATDEAPAPGSADGR